MTPSDTPRYDADRPRYSPRIPSARSISQVIATAGPKADPRVAAAVADDMGADWARAAAEDAIGLGREDAVVVAVAVEADERGTVGSRLRADSCNLVLTTAKSQRVSCVFVVHIPHIGFVPVAVAIPDPNIQCHILLKGRA